VSPARSGTKLSLRLDPWAAEYDASIQLSPDEAPPVVDLSVEGRRWEAVRPSGLARPPRVVFVDGVRRIEHRLLLEGGESSVYGLFGSYAVGAVSVGGEARVERAEVRRVVCTGGGVLVDSFEAPLPGNGHGLFFAPQTVADNAPLAPLQGLQTAMRRSEADLAEALAAAGDLTFLDGPLSFLSRPDVAVVGLVKRLVRTYLDAEAFGLVRALGVGERTPLFLIRHAREPRYSWYARIAAGRPIDATLAGIVRAETSAQLPLGEVSSLADVSTALLPSLASDSLRDARAPQNLHPVGALERELRRRLGDAPLVRRAIEAQLYRGAVA